MNFRKPFWLAIFVVTALSPALARDPVDEHGKHAECRLIVRDLAIRTLPNDYSTIVGHVLADAGLAETHIVRLDTSNNGHWTFIGDQFQGEGDHWETMSRGGSIVSRLLVE